MLTMTMATGGVVIPNGGNLPQGAPIEVVVSPLSYWGNVVFNLYAEGLSTEYSTRADSNGVAVLIYPSFTAPLGKTTITATDGENVVTSVVNVVGSVPHATPHYGTYGLPANLPFQPARETQYG